jgi:hypothetical protein
VPPCTSCVSGAQLSDVLLSVVFLLFVMDVNLDPKMTATFASEGNRLLKPAKPRLEDQGRVCPSSPRAAL